MKKNNIISPETFDDFTYSKKKHWQFFKKNHYDLKLYGKHIFRVLSDLKRYQDMLAFSFILNNIPKGSRILEIGGGDSRILQYFHKDYECWNIDKLDGCGNGPVTVAQNKYKIVRDYMGNFSEELPEYYFDFIFSISALEHVPTDSEQLFDNIIKDINRVLKTGAYSMHCFDIIEKKNGVWTNPFMIYLFDQLDTSNSFISFDQMTSDDNLNRMSKLAYYIHWMPTTRKTHNEFGNAISYNILWKKYETTYDHAVRGGV